MCVCVEYERFFGTNLNLTVHLLTNFYQLHDSPSDDRRVKTLERRSQWRRLEQRKLSISIPFFRSSAPQIPCELCASSGKVGHPNPLLIHSPRDTHWRDTHWLYVHPQKLSENSWKLPPKSKKPSRKFMKVHKTWSGDQWLRLLDFAILPCDLEGFF